MCTTQRRVEGCGQAPVSGGKRSSLSGAGSCALDEDDEGADVDEDVDGLALDVLRLWARAACASAHGTTNAHPTNWTSRSTPPRPAAPRPPSPTPAAARPSARSPRRCGPSSRRRRGGSVRPCRGGTVSLRLHYRGVGRRLVLRRRGLGVRGLGFGRRPRGRRERSSGVPRMRRRSRDRRRQTQIARTAPRQMRKSPAQARRRRTVGTEAETAGGACERQIGMSVTVA
ncbi:hypothetical protein B0H13DRAFT_2048830 [Mycena leptocephala]|nr:hypothetical protein B0H13DRAFT_2048830 [Mycena leptocephala]